MRVERWSVASLHAWEHRARRIPYIGLVGTYALSVGPLLRSARGSVGHRESRTSVGWYVRVERWSVASLRAWERWVRRIPYIAKVTQRLTMMLAKHFGYDALK